ncbi:helix-turn-helix domain-containing protein [Lentzea guizhouensis]|nr:helix-turn-helix domain-containing protein [Lentzea guizhouensis]
MPRGERPLDDGDSPLLSFAAELRQLRTDAGKPSYRELARIAHFSASTLSDAAGGRKLPGLDVTLAYVRACGGNGERWEQRWHDLAVQLAQSQVNDGPSPYVGLKAFAREDADRFFGREALTNALLERLERQRFLAVFGASGEGKSSLLRAGIAPGFANAVVFSPGADPDTAIAEALAQDPDLLVVDQFEEVFTLCEDATQRQVFLASLLNAKCKTAIAIRSDYYPNCAEHPELAQALTDAQVLLGTMSPDELRRAITQPAAKAGCTVETALLTTIVAEAAGRNGVLPLVSHALQETWYRRRGNTLTLAGYQAVGGIHGALAQSAETAYAELDEEQQRLAKQLLLRLSTDGAKRPIPRTDVVGEEVLNVLADARLITVDEHTVEVTHEALFRTWPRLREWLDEDREGLKTHRRLTEAARVWEELGRDTGALYRTARLASATEWLGRSEPELTRTERDFLQASKHLERRRTTRLKWAAAGLITLLLITTVSATVAISQMRAVQEASDIAQSQQLAALSEALVASNPELAASKAVEAYRTHPTPEARGRLLSTATAGRARTLSHEGTLSMGFGKDFVALGQRDGVQLYDATTLKPTVKLSTSASNGLVSWDNVTGGTGVAIEEKDGRVTYWSAPDAQPVVLREVGEAHGLMFAADGGAVLIGTSLWDLQTRRVRHEIPVDRRAGVVALSPDARVVVVSHGVEVVLWELATGRRINGFSTGTSDVNGLAALPDGRLAVAGRDGRVQLWNTATGTLVTTVTNYQTPASVSVSSDGTLLASSGIGGTAVHLYDLVHNVALAPIDAGGDGSRAFFAPDGTIGVLGPAGHVRFWPPGSVAAISAHQVRALSVEDDGTILTFNDAGVFERRDGTTLAVTSRTTTGTGGQVVAEFSPDRRQVVSGATGSPLTVRDVATGRTVRDLADPSFTNQRTPPDSVAFGPHGVVTTGGDVPAGAWTALHDRSAPPRPVTSLHDGRSTVVAFGSRQDEVVLGSSSGQVTVRDIRSWEASVLPRRHDGPVRALAMSPDRRLMASAGEDGMILLWDTATRQPVGELRGHNGTVTALAFSPDSTRLASGGDDHAAVVWDVGSRSAWATLRGHGKPVTHLAWHRDGTTLVSAGQDAVLRWGLDVDQALRGLG